MATETNKFTDQLDEAPPGAWLTVDAPQDAIPETAMSPIAAMRLVTNELAVEGIPSATWRPSSPPGWSRRPAW